MRVQLTAALEFESRRALIFVFSVLESSELECWDLEWHFRENAFFWRQLVGFVSATRGDVSQVRLELGLTGAKSRGRLGIEGEGAGVLIELGVAHSGGYLGQGVNNAADCLTTVH